MVRIVVRRDQRFHLMKVLFFGFFLLFSRLCQAESGCNGSAVLSFGCAEIIFDLTVFISLVSLFVSLLLSSCIAYRFDWGWKRFWAILASNWVLLAAFHWLYVFIGSWLEFKSSNGDFSSLMYVLVPGGIVGLLTAIPKWRRIQSLNVWKYLAVGLTVPWLYSTGQIILNSWIRH